MQRLAKGKNMGYFGSVRFFKNMILLAVIVMIAVPTGLSVHLGQSLRQAEQRLQTLEAEVNGLSEEPGYLSEDVSQEENPSKRTSEVSAMSSFQAESPYADLYPDFYAPQALCANTRETGVIYLTFDDGPSERTKEILDTLKEKDVKATFFVIGCRSEESKAILRRIVEEGHTLAMHSYSHNYANIYASVEDYLADMYQLFVQIRDETGVAPTLFRFPGGSINGYSSGIYQELIAEMMRRGFVPFDWNISSEDAATNGLVPTDRLVNNVLSGAAKVQRGVVLMHDSEPKTTTAAALGTIIDRLRDMNFELKALTPEVMPVLYSYQN